MYEEHAAYSQELEMLAGKRKNIIKVSYAFENNKSTLTQLFTLRGIIH